MTVTTRGALSGLLLPAALLVSSACNSDAVIGVNSKSQSISTRVGQEIEVILGNVGPGTYESPPAVSSGVVVYLGVDVVPPFTPGGPNQRFRFQAIARGQALVTFRRTGVPGASVFVVEDTIEVR